VAVMDILAPLQPGERFHPHTIPLHLVDRLVKTHDLKVFVETGTYLGFTVEHVLDKFEEIYTIELDLKLHEQASAKFEAHEKVICILGDSGKKLADLLYYMDDRALVWLDAHWSAGITARGDKDTAITAELDALGEATRRDHVLMIDDLVDFNGQNGYPTVDELKQRVREINPLYEIHLLDVRRGVLLAIP
jgi:predicted O-methyltransferase YrrM